MRPLILLAVGGAVGTLCRYGLSGWVQGRARTSFPWGTMSVNVLGCLAIGVLGCLLADRGALRPEYRTAILVGVLGGFTTFSSFGYETLRMLNDRDLARAGLYVVGTNLACLAAVWIGYRVTEKLLLSSGSE
jgi:CrcB protein